MAKDKELNRWCSLKKAIQHRPEHVEKYDVIAFQRKGQNIELKKKYLPSLFVEEKTDETFPSTSSSMAEKKNTPKRKLNKKNKSDTNVMNNNDVNSSTNKIHNEASERKDLENMEKGLSQTDKVEASTEGGNDSTLNIKKNKKRKRKLSQSQNLNSNVESITVPKKGKQGSSKKSQKQNHTKRAQDIGISDARLSAYGINPKKFKNKLKYGSI